MSGVTVSLPNELNETITHIGTVHISSSLVLHNVLHVPSFRFNLISVCSLLRDSNLSAHFYPTFCVLQESSRDLMIGRATLCTTFMFLRMLIHLL